MAVNILMMKYRPIRPTRKGRLHDHYILCPEIGKERDITICFRCPYKVRVNFNTIHCNYEGIVIENKGPSRRVRVPNRK